MFDGIIFDVDGTIWNTTTIVAHAWNKAIEQLFPDQSYVTAEILRKQFGKPMNVIADNLFPSLSVSEKEKLMEQCCINEHVEIEKNETNITYDGVVEGIKSLSEKYPLFIVSNCQSGYIELVMRKNQIESYISDFECYGDTGKGKDENITLLLKRNHLENPVYVGDTQGDYEACKKAGVPFIWASYGFGYPEDDAYYNKIKTFSDLLKMLL